MYDVPLLVRQLNRAIEGVEAAKTAKLFMRFAGRVCSTGRMLNFAVARAEDLEQDGYDAIAARLNVGAAAIEGKLASGVFGLSDRDVTLIKEIIDFTHERAEDIRSYAVALV